MHIRGTNVMPGQRDTKVHSNRLVIDCLDLIDASDATEVVCEHVFKQTLCTIFEPGEEFVGENLFVHSTHVLVNAVLRD